MRLPKFSKTESILVAVFVFVIAAMLLSPGVSVSDGHFRLTIVIEETERIDPDSLMFAACWFEEQAEHAIAHPRLYEISFRPPRFSEEGHAQIELPTSGRAGRWGSADTYNHPQHLVVEFQLADRGLEPPRRKRFTLPAARGARTVRLTLP